MSLDVRYLTNGTKTCYVVKNSGVTPIDVQTYNTLEDVPESIRHYAEKEKLTFVKPDLARFMGYMDIFYPNFPSCKHPDYYGEKCIAECCDYAPDGDWKKCPHFKDA